MADIAYLGFKADSKEMDIAAKSMDNMAAAAKRTDVAVQGVSGGLDSASMAAKRAGGATMGNATAVQAHTTRLTMNTTAVHANNAALQIHATNSKMAAFQQRNLVFQLNDVAVSLASGMNPLMVAAQQGSQISTIYGPNEGGLGRAFKETGKLMLGVISKFPLLTAAVVGGSAAFAGMAYEMSETLGKTVTFGDVAIATFKTIGQGIYSFIQPGIAAIAPWFTEAYNLVVASTKYVVNSLIGGFKGAFDFIRTAWGNLPAVFSDIFTLIVFNVQDAFAVMAQDAMRSFNVIIDGYNDMAGRLGVGRMGRFNPQSIQLPDAPNLTGAINEPLAAFKDAMNTDYMGQFYEAIQANVVKGLEEADEAAKKTGKTIKDATLADPWKGLRKVTEGAKEDLSGIESVFGGFFSDFRNGLKNGESAWQSFKNAGMNALNSILDKMVQVASQQLVLSIFGGGIPGFATGTNYAPGGMATVGENGPETVYLPRGSQVIPANQTKRMMEGERSGGTTTVQVVLSGDLEARIMDQAANQSVQIVKQAAPGIAKQGSSGARESFARSGGWTSL